MSFPKGITRVFTDRRGLAHILPLIVWLVPCGLLGFILPSRNKALTAGAAVVFAVTWIISCSARNYGGGATLGGRFLVAVAPLLLPATAFFWERTSPVIRWWLLLLGLASIGLGIIQLSVLPALGRNFAMPFQTIPMVLLPLWGWRLPWPGAGFIITVAAVHALWVLFPALQRRPAPWMLGCLLAANIAMQTGREGLPASEPFLGKRHAAQQLSRLDLERAFMDPAKALEDFDLFSISNMLMNRRDTFRSLRVTTEKLGSMHADGVISQPRVEVNDWNERDLRWVTLHPPFRPGAGLFAFKIAGSVSGAATVRLALREGSRTILETPLTSSATGIIEFSRFFEMQSSRNLLYILIHLENEGETNIDFLGLSPFGSALEPPGLLPR